MHGRCPPARHLPTVEPTRPPTTEVRLAITAWIVLSVPLLALLARVWRGTGAWTYLLIPSAITAGAFLVAALSGFEHIHDAFVPLKLISVWLGLFFMWVVRFRGEGGARGAKWAIAILLAVNILEAVIAESFDLATGGADRALGGHPANIWAGLLVLLMVRGADHLEVAPDEERALSYDLGWDWILAYSLWNFVFIYGSRPPDVAAAALAGAAVLHLGAPLLAAAGEGHKWLELRAFVLLWVVACAMAAPYPPFIFDTSALYWRPLADGLSFASGIVATAVCWRRWRGATSSPS
jgi:hypothetical protein